MERSRGVSESQLALFPGPTKLSVAFSTVKRRKAGRSLGTRLFFEMDVSEVCGFEDGRRAFNTATSTTANSGFGLYGKQDSDRRFD